MTDLDTSRKLNAPMFHGGVPLSKRDLASEAQTKRHTFSEKYQRISRPVPMMRIDYDVVVIGSGYGGAVAASRMARAGKSVCLLELGKERWPGEFPVELADAAPELHVTGNIENEAKIADLNAGDPQGLYHLIMGEGQNAFVANGTINSCLKLLTCLIGLGGTSLLNANIFIEADHRTLSQDVFPPEIRNNPSVLEECNLTLCSYLTLVYKRAGYVLQPEIYPEDFPQLSKLTVLEKQAKLLGPEYSERFRRLRQTTTFKDGLNNMGVYQKKSTLSGQDTTGINDGSKNSTLMNYLPDAWNHGAEMYALISLLTNLLVSADAKCDISSLSLKERTSGLFISHGMEISVAYLRMQFTRNLCGFKRKNSCFLVQAPWELPRSCFDPRLTDSNFLDQWVGICLVTATS